MSDTRDKLSSGTVALHWIVAVGMLIMMAVGWYMAENEVHDIYPIHKSVGMVLLLFIVWRAARRLMMGFPPNVRAYPAWEHQLAVVVHWVLLIGTLLFPLSGMMMSAAGGHGLYLFGLELVPAHIVNDKAVPINKAAAEFGHTMHGLLLWVMLTAIVLHVAGALKHHLMDGDGTLRRMLGQRV